jgi:hypothetical protein
MFPNFRLMVVTVLAAILGISCGLGLFATFRVNHEPLARLSDGSASLRLALDKTVPAPRPPPLSAAYPVNDAARPLAAPLLPKRPDPPGATAARPTAPAAATADAGTAPSSPAGTDGTAAKSAPATTAIPASSQTGGDADVRMAPNTESQPDLAVAAPAESAEPPVETVPAPEISPAAEVSQGETAVPTSGEEGKAKPEQNESTATVTTETPTGQAPPANEQANTAPAPNETTATPVTDKPADQAAHVPSAADDRGAQVKETTKETTKEVAKETTKETKKRVAKAVRQTLPVRRGAKLAPRRTQSAVAYQSPDPLSQQFSQSAYQWTDTAFQAPQTAHRVAIRRRRFIAKKTPPKPPRQSSSVSQSSAASGAQ